MTTPALFGYDLFGEPVRPERSGPLAQRYEFPPFSVLNARDGDWQNRKRAWTDLGISGEIGRSAKSYNVHDWMVDKGGGKRADGDGTSIFDPVLCELVYRWFCPPGGQVVDPFAGGSVRGIVAACLGFKYWGSDLSTRQIAANEAQRGVAPEDASLTWVAGDSLHTVREAPLADLVFTCPPYGDLERYSDDPRDISTMEYHTFLAEYGRILIAAERRLRPGRFLAIVVGDFRDKRTGNYRGFVADTVNICRDMHLGLYNDAVLVTAVGSLPIRITKQFEAGRKMGKTHQNLLVFVKGDGRAAANACRGNS